MEQSQTNIRDFHISTNFHKNADLTLVNYLCNQMKLQLLLISQKVEDNFRSSTFILLLFIFILLVDHFLKLKDFR